MKHSRNQMEQETFKHINSFIQRLVADVEKSRKQESESKDAVPEAPYVHIEDPDAFDEAFWK